MTDALQLQTQIEELTAQILELKKSVADDLVTTQVLIRTNNLLLSRFILALEKTRKKIGLPEREIAFKFELLEEEYKELVAEFGQDEVDKAMYRLDRLLLTNRQQCPRNIKKYLHKRLKKSQNNRSIKKGACISGVISVNNDNMFNRNDSSIFINKSIQNE